MGVVVLTGWHQPSPPDGSGRPPRPCTPRPPTVTPPVTGTTHESPPMRLYARALLVALMSLTFTAGAFTLTSPAQSATWAPELTDSFDPVTDLNEFEDRILVEINKARARRDLPKVKVFQSCVDKYAERWATRLKRIDDLVHRDLTTVLEGCDLHWAGETLVSGTLLTPSGAVRAWLDSPPHRAVILKERARLAGIGVTVNATGKVFAVLNFGDRT